MSTRQSLYGQSLVRNANALSLNNDNQSVHWKRDYFTPTKDITLSSNVTPSSTPFSGEDGSIATPVQQTYNFKVKTWVVNNDYTPLVDGEEDDILDLELYSTIKTKSTTDLTDAAIRGAVASEGSIAGLSKANDIQSEPREPEAIVVDEPEELKQKAEEDPEAIVIDQPNEVIKIAEIKDEAKTEDIVIDEKDTISKEAVTEEGPSIAPTEPEQIQPSGEIAPVTFQANQTFSPEKRQITNETPIGNETREDTVPQKDELAVLEQTTKEEKEITIEPAQKDAEVEMQAKIPVINETPSEDPLKAQSQDNTTNISEQIIESADK